MKKLSSGLLMIVITLLFSACGNDRSSTSDTTNSNTMSADSSMAADSMNHTGTMGTADMTSPNGFAMHAASGGMMEVELATLAQQKASNKEVKDFARMLEQDHTKANNELKSIANGKNMTLPTSMMPDHQGHVTNMNSMTGSDFDRAYIDMMVNDHTEDINMFQQASNGMTDTELKNFATKTLPILQKHLDKAKQLQGKLSGGTGTGTSGGNQNQQ